MAEVAAPLFKKRANKTSNIRKRPATPPPAAISDSESDYTDDDEAGTRIKRRKREGITTTVTLPQQALNTSKSTSYTADRSTAITAHNDATKASNWYTDAALAAKDAKSSNSTSIAAPSSYGPVKAAPTNIRAITVTDFAPDVCKDYKQTGFCGFGDSCKFLHAREDYKQGWQLDKEWENAGKKDKNKKPGAGDGDEDLDAEEKMLRDIPFACVICKEGYKDPIVTKCGHYFCQKCAMDRYMKEKKKTCAACGADTLGSFPVAKKLKGLLERKRIRDEERAKGKTGEDGDG